MNSGLYALAGASATATAAAWANLLLDPMTNVSNVYLGLSLVAAGRGTGWPVPPGRTAFGGPWAPLPSAGPAPPRSCSRGSMPDGRGPVGWAAPGSGCSAPPGGPSPGAAAGRTSVAGSTVTASWMLRP